MMTLGSVNGSQAFALLWLKLKVSFPQILFGDQSVQNLIG